MKPGYIFLSLLLALAISGFILVATITQSQKNVSSAQEDRLDPTSFRYTLSEHLGSPSQWLTYQNPRYQYSIKHPDSWESQENPQSSADIVNSYEAYLGSKIVLKVTVTKYLRIPKTAPKTKFAENDFYILEDKPNHKSAVSQHNNLFYVVDLYASTFFGDSTEFKSAYFTILKNFSFVSNQSQANLELSAN